MYKASAVFIEFRVGLADLLWTKVFQVYTYIQTYTYMYAFAPGTDVIHS